MTIAHIALTISIIAFNLSMFAFIRARLNTKCIKALLELIQDISKALVTMNSIDNKTIEILKEMSKHGNKKKQ